MLAILLQPPRSKGLTLRRRLRVLINLPTCGLACSIVIKTKFYEAKLNSSTERSFRIETLDSVLGQL